MFVENRDFYIPRMHPTPLLGDRRRNIVITFGMGKWIVWLSDRGKILMVRLLVLIQYTRTAGPWDGQTATAWRQRPRGRNWNKQQCDILPEVRTQSIKTILYNAATPWISKLHIIQHNSERYVNCSANDRCVVLAICIWEITKPDVHTDDDACITQLSPWTHFSACEITHPCTASALVICLMLYAGLQANRESGREIGTDRGLHECILIHTLISPRR